MSAQPTFTESRDAHVIELDCVRCGEALRFTPNAKLGAVRDELEAHRCKPTALIASERCAGCGRAFLDAADKHYIAGSKQPECGRCIEAWAISESRD